MEHEDPLAPLLVVAAQEEAEHLAAVNLPMLVTGIGRLHAACALSSYLAARAAAAEPMPRMILNVGTAGGLGHLVGVHRVREVMLHDFSHSAVVRLTGHTAYPTIHLGGAGAVLATGDTFVETTAQKESLACHADMVDMEGYAVAYVARRFDVPVELIKMVSDSADEHAGRLWQRGVAACGRALADHLRGYSFEASLASDGASSAMSHDVTSAPGSGTPRDRSPR